MFTRGCAKHLEHNQHVSVGSQWAVFVATLVFKVLTLNQELTSPIIRGLLWSTPFALWNDYKGRNNLENRS